TISQIVGNMRPDNGPGTSAVCPTGCTGVERMTNILYDLRVMDAGTCMVSGNNVGYVHSAARCTALGGTWTPPTNQYTNPLSNTTADTFGRLTALMADMGSNGGLNTARMVNEVNAQYLTSLDGAGYRVSYLVQQINRMRYLSRMLSEMTSADLMIQLLNSPNMNVVTIRNLVNGQGNLAYGTNTVAANLASFYTSASQTGHMPNPTTTYGAGGSGFDTLGRMIQFINSITSGIENVVTLMNVIADTRYMGATNDVTTPNSMPTPYNPDQGGDRNCYDSTPCGVRNYGYGMLNEADRIDYLSNLINGIQNLDLFLTIVNGPGSCTTNMSLNSRSSCLGAGHTWQEGTMGSCSSTTVTISIANPAVITRTGHTFLNGSMIRFTSTGALPASIEPNVSYYVRNAAANTFNISLTPTGPLISTAGMSQSGTHSIWPLAQDACTRSGGGVWTANSPIAPNSAHYLKMIRIVNDVAGSTRKGSGTKPVGDISILSDVINDLGWYAGAPQPLGNQTRIITITNDVVYCGINPANDRNITTGPHCTIPAYTNQASCVAAGGTWNNLSQVLLCDQPIGYNYNKVNDFYDPRPRVANTMLAMDSAFPMSIIVGQVENTQKTVRVMNGTRRINTIIKSVNWMPGEASRDLINYTNLDQIYRAFDYLANNLDPDEDSAASAFTSLIFWGNGIGQGPNRNGTCMYFTGVGPRRMAGVMNSEQGTYLEGLLQKFGWRTVIPEMICGLAPHGSSYENYTGYNDDPNWTTTGTAINSNAVDNVCRNTPATDRCMTIPGTVSSVNFKQKEVLTTQGSCSNPSYKTRHSCVSNGGTWDNTSGSFTWTFGIRNNGVDNNSCKNYYPEKASALFYNPELDDTVFLGFNTGFPLYLGINAGIGGVWDVLKGSGLIGWLLTNNGTINYPPRRTASGTIGDTGYTCTDGSSNNEWDCTRPGMNDAGNGNVSYYRWGRRCSMPRRGATNCDANYTACETTCQGRWIPDKDYTDCRIDPASGIEPIR
ncbi:MAG: hypothetical protein N2Z22_07940, partial [Turneriella sp.]|nr:hypothetical protein [Turneriella sp.]